jgi:tRNA threonylcarbamoyl adenosine modification protein YeaZ
VNYTLSIDTSAGTSVSLHHNGRLVAEVEYLENMKHAERIGASIAEVLKTAGVDSGRISAVVVGRGPAPFTGLRIGIAAGMMFAEGSGAKLFGVVSLDAIAKAALGGAAGDAGASESPASQVLSSQVSADRPLLVTADARRSEIYWALYSGLNEHGVPVRIDGPGVIKPPALEELLAARGIDPIRTQLPVAARQLTALFEAQLADGSASHDVTALYLREADATVPRDLREAGKKVSG